MADNAKLAEDLLQQAYDDTYGKQRTGAEPRLKNANDVERTLEWALQDAFISNDPDVVIPEGMTIDVGGVNLTPETGEIGLGETLSNMDLSKKIPFWGTGEAAGEAVRLRMASNRIRKAQEAGEDIFSVKHSVDLEDLRNAHVLAQYMSKRGTTVPSDIAKVLSEVPSFIAEMFVTGGMATAGKKAGAKLLTKAAPGFVGKALRTGTGMALGAAGRAVTVGAPRVIEGAVRRSNPAVFFDDQSVRFEDSGVSPMTAILQSLGDVAIEYFSEEAGEHFGKVFSAFGKKVPAAKKLFDAVESVWKKIPGNRSGSFDAVLKKAGWHGVLSEMGEERLGDVMRSVMGVDDTTVAEALIPTSRQFWTEAISFGIMGSGFAGASRIIGGAGVDLNRWVEENPKEAVAISEMENPSRTDFTRRGLPALNEAQRKEVSQKLLEARTDLAKPETPLEEEVAPEEILEAPERREADRRTEDVAVEEERREMDRRLKELQAKDPSEITVEEVAELQQGVARVRREAEEKDIDQMTGLPAPNVVNKALDAPERANEVQVAFDFDYLGDANEVAGHPDVNRALGDIGRIIREELPDHVEAGLAGRSGGDEFRSLADMLEDGEVDTERIENILSRISEEVYVTDKATGERLPITLTIGVGVGPDGSDATLSKAKKRGRNRILVDFGGKITEIIGRDVGERKYVGAKQRAQEAAKAAAEGAVAGRSVEAAEVRQEEVGREEGVREEPEVLGPDDREAARGAVQGVDTVESLSALPFPELKAEARKRGLKIKGGKKRIAQDIVAFDQKAQEPEAKPKPKKKAKKKGKKKPKKEAVRKKKGDKTSIPDVWVGYVAKLGHVFPGLRKPRHGNARVLSYDPDSNTAEIEFTTDLKYRKGGVDRAVYARKGDKKTVSLSDPELTFAPLKSTLGTLKRADALAQITDPAIKEEIDAAEAQFNDIAAGYSAIAGIDEADYTVIEVKGKLVETTAKQRASILGKEIAKWLGVEVDPVTKAQNLGILMRTINIEAKTEVFSNEEIAEADAIANRIYEALPDDAKLSFKRRVGISDIKKALPGATVEAAENGGWRVPLPDGSAIDIRMTSNIPTDIPAIMRAYDVSEATARGMVTAGIAGAMIPPGISMTLPDGTTLTSQDVVVMLDPAMATSRTVRHELIHAFRVLSKFDTKAGQRIWNALEMEYGSEEAIARASEEWTKPEGLFEKIRQFLRNIFSKLGFDLDAETAMSNVFSARFWEQQMEQQGAEPKYSLAGEQLEKNNEFDIPLTSLKNEVVDELRRLRGEGELEGVDPETQQEWLDQASDTIANDSEAGTRLVNELLKQPRNLSEREVALLQMYYRSVSNRFEELSNDRDAAQDSGDSVSAATSQAAVVEQMAILEKIEEAARVAGREWGRAGVARQITLARDFSLAGMTRKARAATGQPLTEKQQSEVASMARELAAANKRVAELEAEAENAKKIEVIQQQTKRDSVRKKRKTVVKKQKDALSKLKNVWESMGNSFVEKPTPPADTGIRYQAVEGEGAAQGESQPAQASDELKAAAAQTAEAYFESGVSTFGEFWSIVRPHLGENGFQAEATFRAAWESVAGTEAAVEFEETDVAGISREARKIQRRLVEAGVRDLDQIVDAVHASLRESMPNMTRRQAMDALSMYGQYSQLSQEETDQIIRDINGQLQQLAKLEDMEAGQAPKKTGKERRTPSDEERRLLKLVNEAKKRGGFEVTDHAKQLRSALDAAKRQVRNRITDLEWEIENQERIVRETTDLKADAELKQLRAERDALVEVHRKMFPPKKATKEQRIAAATKAVDKAIVDLEARLAEGDISPQKRPEPLSSPELDAKRARLDALRAQRDALRAAANPKMTPEQRARRAYEATKKRQLADYQGRIARGEFAKKKKEPRKLSPSELKWQKRVDDIKQEFYQKAAKWHLENLSPLMRAGDLARETAHLSRSIMTSVDLSAVLRQGGIAVYSHPGLAAKASVDMLKAFASKQADFNSAEAIKNDPMGQFAQTAGLSITTDDGKVSSQEEAFMGRWAKHVPVVAASERAYTTFLNNMRFNMFKLLVNNLGRSGQVTLDEAKVIARYVNVATGRSGNFQIFGLSASNLNTVFFAPRYVASRFQYPAMLLALPFRKTTWRVKRALAAEYGRAALGAATFISTLMALGMLVAGDDDEKKPTLERDLRSSDFGKIKIGETRIDPLAGLSQALVVSARVAPDFLGGGRTKTMKGEIKEFGGEGFKPTTRATVLARFLRTKLAPVPGAFWTTQDDMTNVVGEKMTPLSLTGQLFLPLSIRDVRDSITHHGVPKGTAMSILALLGASVNTYGPKTAYMAAEEEERKEIFKSDLKRAQWDDPALPYSGMLNAEQLKKHDLEKTYDLGGLVYAVTTEKPSKEKRTDEEYAESLARWQKSHDRAVERLKGSDPDLARAAFREYWLNKRKAKLGTHYGRRLLTLDKLENSK